MGQKAAFFSQRALHLQGGTGLRLEILGWLALSCSQFGAHDNLIEMKDHWNQRLNQHKQSFNPTRYFPHRFLEILIFDRADPTNVGVWTKFMVDQ